MKRHNRQMQWPKGTQKMGAVAQEMQTRLIAALAPTHIELIDDSEKHRGHAGHTGAGESHFTLIIESPRFAGQSRVAMQRQIYAALGELMQERVHALAIRASAPAA